MKKIEQWNQQDHDKKMEQLSIALKEILEDFRKKLRDPNYIFPCEEDHE